MTILPGDSFGEFSAIDSEPRSTSVVTSDECYAGVLTAKQFRDLLKTHPDISFELLKVLVAHLRQLNTRVLVGQSHEFYPSIIWKRKTSSQAAKCRFSLRL